MDGVNLNSLKIFMEVATSNSFLEASNKIYISQPAISKCMSRLEDDLKVKLFYREKKGITLTKSGEILLKYLKESKNILLSCERALVSLNNVENGKIVIGIQSHIARNYLLDKIKDFKEIHPNVKIEILDMPTSLMIEYLKEKKIDFIIDSMPINTIYNNMSINIIKSLDTCFVSNLDNIIEIKSINEIDNLNLIMPPKGSNIRKNIDEFFYKKNYEFKPLFEFGTEELIIDAVKKNFGVGYILEPSNENQLKKNNLSKLKIDYELPKVDIALVTIDNYLNAASKLFINEEIKKES